MAARAPSMFQNAQGFQINNGQFNNVGRDINNYYSEDPFRLLYMAIKDVGASYNSEVRYPPPRCDPDTRKEVLKVLHDWIQDQSPEDRIFWLYGPAGAGKSAIAQTIAEKGQKERYLVSSFFFSRENERRNTAKSLFLTIAYGLAMGIPELRKLISEAIKQNPAVLEDSLEMQVQKLIIEPCRALVELCGCPWIIIIDGLDECSGGRHPNQEQKRIIFIIVEALSTLIARIRFLICSRPEPHIREALDTDVVRPYLRRVVLDDTFQPSRDIETYLWKEFTQIRRHPRNHRIKFPVPWPAPSTVDILVQRASGMFIYTATVVKFVNDEYSNPCTQLAMVLNPGQQPESDLELDSKLNSPFHDLDVLYRHILSINCQRSKVRDVLRAIFSFRLVPRRQWKATPRQIEWLLLLPEEEVSLVLRGMHSILNINGPDDEIGFFHASFGDFCRGEKRSGYFFLGDEQDQHSHLTGWILRVMKDRCQTSTSLSDCDRWLVFNDLFNSLVYHSSKSNPKHHLKYDDLDFLQGVDFIETSRSGLNRHIVIRRPIGSGITADPLQEPRQAIEHTEVCHNPPERHLPPIGAHQEALKVIHEWIYDPSPENHVFWLCGPTGSEISAIAQTITDMGQREGYLHSSFFISREDPGRDIFELLSPILKYGYKISIPKLHEPVTQAIKGNIQVSLEEAQKLVVASRRPWLIVIEGLDQYSGGKQEQEQILKIIYDLVLSNCDIRILICSRPELHLQKAFDTDAFRPYLRRVVLDDTFSDIHTFLLNEFRRIRKSHNYDHIWFPSSWPARGVIDELAQKASGRFIYARTVVGFIDHEDPREQLEIILRSESQLNTSPVRLPNFHGFSNSTVYRPKSHGPGNTTVYRPNSHGPSNNSTVYLPNSHGFLLRDVLRAIFSFQLVPHVRAPTHWKATPQQIKWLLLLSEEALSSGFRQIKHMFPIDGPDDEIPLPDAEYLEFFRDPISGFLFVGNEHDQHEYLASRCLSAIKYHCGSSNSPFRWDRLVVTFSSHQQSHFNVNQYAYT
uniref:NACHT domain-containing protein n=1 Tax=Moniliophthora roreri TaxID=221103 RepID=A0A0W0G8X7_MONRR